MRLIGAILFMVALAVVPASAIQREDPRPPDDKPGPTVQVEQPGHEIDPPTFAWWAEWAGYVFSGPFWTEQDCGAALRRLPVYVRCVPRRF